MHFSSTLNPLSKSNGDVPIAIVSYEGKRKFVLKTETFEDMIDLVRGYFNLAQDPTFIRLETCTLDVCQGRSIEVDASAWVHMWRVLDEITVVAAPENRTMAPIGEANPHATPVPSAPDTSPSISTAVLPANQEQHTPPVAGRSALTTTSPAPSIPTAVAPPNQEQHTPVAGGSALTISPSLSLHGLLLERPSKTPLMEYVSHGERDNDESATDELVEDSATVGQATDAPSWFILSSPTNEVKLEKKLNTTTTGDGSTTWEHKKPRAPATSSTENDVFTSTKGSEIGTNDVGKQANERFSISIKGPDGRSLDFRLKKSHTVQKVLLTACKYFMVDFHSGYLCNDDDDALNNSDTVMQAGLRNGSNLVLWVGQPESESGEEED